MDYKESLSLIGNEYAKEIEGYFSLASEELDKLSGSSDILPKEDFHFSKSGRIGLLIGVILTSLHRKIASLIMESIAKSTELAMMNADELEKSVIGETLRSGDDGESMQPSGNEYMSEKIDTSIERFVEEKEQCISSGEELDLSESMGVRSAERFMADEANASYISTSTERWRNNPFVVGFRIRRSKAHPYPCPLCNMLSGDFPKDFKFTGWHPNCRCEVVPIMCTSEEGKELKKKIDAGEDVSGFHSKNEVRKPHAGFNDWLKENKDRLSKARENGKIPTWIDKNDRYILAKSSLPEHVKKRRKEIENEAKRLFYKSPLYHPSINTPINVYNTCIKEWLNQPFSEYEAKNELLLRLPDIFSGLKHLDPIKDSGKHAEVLFNHIFEVYVNGKKGWIIAHEMSWGEIKLYGISDDLRWLYK